MREHSTVQKPSFKEALKFWFKLGWISFGGTAGHIATMHEHLVEKKKWISDSKFLHALNNCMVLPGPEAQQLAIYIGWKLHGKKGGWAAGTLFVLPSMFILLALSIIYVLYGNIPLVTAMFGGLKPAVIAIIIVATFKVGQKALHGPLHYFIAAMAFVCTYFFNLSMIPIIAGTFVLAIIIRYLKPSLLHIKQKGIHADHDEHAYYINKNTTDTDNEFKTKLLLKDSIIWLICWLVPLVLFFIFFTDFKFWKDISLFFTQTALITIGGSYTVIPYVAKVSVTKWLWLNKMQMIDGFALAETTPGPLIIVLSYVGFMAGYNHFDGSLLMGTISLLATTYFTFLPCFFLIFIGAPLIEKTQGNLIIEGILSLITATVVGVILNLTLYLGKDVLFPNGVSFEKLDYIALIWVIASLVFILKWKMNILYLIGLSVLYGLLHWWIR
jgi:chromate transporter